MKRILIICGLMAVSGLCWAKPMNVVFILADDLGWADTTLYGHTSLYETPNLERLAKRGMTFTRAYSASPLCSPTRAGILTGQTPARIGFTAPAGHVPAVELHASVKKSDAPGNKAVEPSSVTRLDTALPTLGKLIQADGYKTGHFGKWHVGLEPYSPLEHGFDVDVPHWHGPGPAGSFVAPWAYPDFKANYPKEHIEDRMAEEAVAWMNALPKNKPFFMNYWQFSVHAPFDAKQELIEEYRKKIDPDDPQRSPTYAAMVHSCDDAVGSLLDAVDQAGMADETIIIFISDNGGNMYDGIDGTTPTSNAPLRGGKGSPFEGGIRVPCVVVWPGVTPPGSRSDEIIQTTDFYPTLLNGLGISMPENHAVDGIDITPALRGGALKRDAIYTYFPHSPQAVPDWLPPSMAIHSGDWKLLRLFHHGENGTHDYLLYNLKDDIGEKNNLAAAFPEKVQQLDGMIEDYIQRADVVVPVANPAFNPNYYIPENIGVPIQHQKVIGVIDGWKASGTCMIHQENGALVVESTGEDPYFELEKMDKVTGGSWVVRLRMKSNAAGTACLYYNTPAPGRTVNFPVQHDGKWHEYEVKIPAATLSGLRIDPSRGPGTMEIDWIRLEQAGQVVQKWNFE
ncbi:Arylsulfatase [Pontiella desulfatans]|uniref:Arylsulfatase n=1 Tax=Pontiella desulfatans TaxID=2750659 RepID=A0A6C2U701_PONDE|nr:sulfatase [Pontiella desulfatans]SPS73993.1 sulfatase S1_16 [Kiritimatiellales bacterium]VGO15715.1 Arylsulfatase [Pontiella desulfatans]